MKIIYSVIILFILSSISFSQNNYLEIYKKSTNIHCGWLDNNYESEINNIYYLNVYEYFHLDEKYNTPLKKKYFEKSGEYKQLLDSLKLAKKEMLNKWFNVETSIEFGHQYNIETGKYMFSGVTEYDRAIIKRGYIAISCVYLPQLNGYYSYEDNGYFPILLIQISCNEKLAMKLEDIKDIKLVFLFKVDGVKKINYKNEHGGLIDENLPIAKNTVLLIMDNDGNLYGTVVL
jgi:hypothetical protein